MSSLKDKADIKGKEVSDANYKSKWTDTLNTINPFAAGRDSEPTTPKKLPDKQSTTPNNLADTSANRDHPFVPLYGKSFKSYPNDCPPLEVRWYHAVDIPKRVPHANKRNKQDSSTDQKKEQTTKPKKFSSFSKDDSNRIEKRYQKLLVISETQSSRHETSAPQTARKEGTEIESRVPVNEDFLFDVDISKRELMPVYWAGPTYEARRGTWFHQEGSNFRPCDENLAAQVEEGYLKAQPWKLKKPNLDSNNTETEDPNNARKEKPNSDQVQHPTAMGSEPKTESKTDESAKKTPLPTQRLFGAHMNSFITYEDGNIAWLTSESMLSWVTTSVYERFAGGGHMSGMKLVRGYREPKQPKSTANNTTDASTEKENRNDIERMRTIREVPEASHQSQHDRSSLDNQPQLRLERKLSSIIANDARSGQRIEEDAQKFSEEEIRNDYLTVEGESQKRDIKHLILVTHGIGQRLSLRMESVNFIHDVNTMRKTMKSVYLNSNQLRSLNREPIEGPGNCSVQVLPVCWRHMVDFPQRRSKPGESDLTDTPTEEDEYPSLEDITVEGVSFARSLMSDLALDVLLYQSAYRAEIAKIVIRESNRIVKLFRERNPDFDGQIHVMGHSLGSAILFDILCQQQRQARNEAGNPLRFLPSRDKETFHIDNGSSFRFDIDDFYCLGSPVGLFQMLNGKTIVPRESLHKDREYNSKLARSADSPSDYKNIDAMLLDDSISSPEVSQLFNIFHPSDPISYRIEPLIVPKMAQLKPKALPYTKKGIFGAVGTQSLTGIGAKVGQSVSGLWSSLSTGITANLLPASLRPENGGNIEELATELHTSSRRDSLEQGLKSEAELDNDMESLYTAFQQRDHNDSSTEKSQDSQKLRKEKDKLMALNRNGRVDYNIQESALDFNPINTIASHIGYWGDEDVNHFILSQLLSRKASNKAA